MKVAIYGGSFNPIHNGHVEIVSKLSKIFDKVFVMPAFISPFKQEENSTQPLDRLNMMRLALKDMPKNVEISTYEIEKEQISYTIDTVRHLKNTFGGAMYLVLGAENLPSLDKWKDIDKLKELVEFYIINREGIKNDIKIPQNLNLVKIVRSNLQINEVSSSLIKLNLAFNKPDNYLDENVKRYITLNNLYTELNRYVKEYKTFSLSEKRIEHSYLSAKYSINLSKIHGADTNKAMIALILHDIVKSSINLKQSKQEILAPFLKYLHDLEVFDNFFSPLYHSEIARQLASNYFFIKDLDIINAIRYHTTARPNMSTLEKVVFLSDKLEQSRTYKGVDELRRIANRNLNEAMYANLSATSVKLKKVGAELFSLSVEALKFYKNAN